MRKPRPIPVLLQHHRKLAGLTQKQVYEALGVSTKIVGFWESGFRSPNGENLKKLARLYECEVADFFDVNWNEVQALARARLREYLLAPKVKSEGERARLIVSLTNTFRNDADLRGEMEQSSGTSVSDLVHIYGDPDPDRMRIPVRDDLIPITEESTDNVKGFWTSQDEKVVLSGGRNCGKTYNLCLYALWLCENVPGIQIGMCRSEMTGIGETLWASFKLIFKYPYARDPRNPFIVVGGLHQPSKIVCENGSEIDFFGLHSENTQRGKQKHVIIINQVEAQDSQTNYSSLIAAMTGERAGTIQKPESSLWEWRILMDANPDGKTHWVWRLKETSDLRWFDFTHRDHPKYFDSVKGEYTDSGIKVREDIKEAYPPGHERDRMLDGLWVSAEGQVLNCFFPDKHLLPPDRQPTIEANWKHYRTTDWGVNDPHICLWFSIAPDGKVYVWQEYAKCHERDEVHAEFILDHSRGFTYTSHFADSEDANARLNFNEAGISTRTVDKDIKGGINLLNRLFAEDRLFIFEGLRINKDPAITNQRLPEDLPAEIGQWRYPAKKTGSNADDLPDKSCSDHRIDALRYGMVGVFGIKKRVLLPMTSA